MAVLLPGFKAAVTASRAVGAFLAELEFRSGVVDIWTGRGTLNWKGRSFFGFGHLQGISEVTTDNQVQANGLTFALSGVTLTSDTKPLLAYVQNEVRQGKSGRLWFALFDSSGAMIVEPDLVFDGLMDVPLIRISGDSFDISISCESRLARLQTRPGLRWDNETQRRFFPTDRGFEYVPELQNKVV